jgi:hypothetical protein
MAAGKGDKMRPCATGRRERELRIALAYGEITQLEYNIFYAELRGQGLVTRNGRKIGGECCVRTLLQKL